MPSTLTALLCLQLCLSQRINTEEQNLPKPIIWAQPSTRVPKGTPVYIWCQGPQSASEYQLFFRGSILDLKKAESHRSRSKVNVFIPQMTLHTAGEYACFYRSGELQSEPSDPLDLVVTGLYDTPKLQVHPGHEVTLGENVTFFCHLVSGTSKFFLLKEGRSNQVQQRYGNRQAEFPMGPMTRAHRGTYRCFGSYSDYTWSSPSEPVTLLISGVGNTSLAPTGPAYSLDYWVSDSTTEESELQEGKQTARRVDSEERCKAKQECKAEKGGWGGCSLCQQSPCLLTLDSAFWDHTTQNLIRIGLACMVLMAVVWLLAEDWLSRKRDQEGTNRSASWECRRRWRVQRSLEEEQRDAISMCEVKATAGPGTI